LRVRQSQSVALPSLTPFEAVDGAIANIDGVTRHKLYENDTDNPDANGLPPHSIAAIVEGGDATTIANTLRGVKGQGLPHLAARSSSCQTNTAALTVLVFSPGGCSSFLQNYDRGTYWLHISDRHRNKVCYSCLYQLLAIGANVVHSRVYSPANLGVVSGGNARYYDITELLIGKSVSSLAAANISVAFDQSASCDINNIELVVT
jgi:hypothetical protein